MGPYSVRRTAWLTAVTLVSSLPSLAGSEPPQRVSPVAAVPPVEREHRHTEVELAIPPIVSRIDVPLVHPRRLHLDGDGDLLVADWGSGTITKIDATGRSTVLASGLDEPAGLAVDRDENLYVSLRAQGIAGAGVILRISPTGDRSVVVEGLTAPTAIAVDPANDLYVANFLEGSITRIASDGTRSLFANDIPQPSAMAFDSAGQLYVTSSAAGSVFRVSRQGIVQTLASGLSSPSDLAFDPNGHLIVANYGGRELVYVPIHGQSQKFANVPKGTIALAFDRDGNLLVANWDRPSLLKIISTISIPCPHCDQRIPVKLRGKPSTERGESTEDETIY